MFTDWLRRVFRGTIDTVARALTRLGLSANAVTIIGSLLTMGASLVVATGRFRLGGALLILTTIFDALDGAVARQRGAPTKFGSFLDAVLDRVSDSSVLLALAWWYMGLPGRTEELLAYVAIVGSILVSYTRARAEVIGVECKVGLFTRVERWLLLLTALILGFVPLALWVLAIGTVVTAAHRAIYVYAQIGEEPLSASAKLGKSEESC